MTLLEIIRKKKLVTVTDVTGVTVTPVLKPSVTSVTPVTVTNQKSGKVVFPEDIKLEERRIKVLKMLADQSGIQRAFLTDTETDLKNVIVTIALRDQYTFEMQIPKHRYDPFMLLEMIEKGSVQ